MRLVKSGAIANVCSFSFAKLLSKVDLPLFIFPKIPITNLFITKFPKFPTKIVGNYNLKSLFPCAMFAKLLFKSEKREDNILGDLVGSHDNVLLCMPQDDGAPTGRLILPQSVVIRAIMDKSPLYLANNTEKLVNGTAFPTIPLT